MRAQDRRHGHRFIMKVPLRFHAMKETAVREEHAASMNISAHGVYFATDQKVREGLLVQLHLKMPRQITGDESEEWTFTRRVAHVESLGRQNGKSGVGVQFLFYEVPTPRRNGNGNLPDVA